MLETIDNHSDTDYYDNVVPMLCSNESNQQRHLFDCLHALFFKIPFVYMTKKNLK